MTSGQICLNIMNLVELEEHGKLTKQEKEKIRQILFAHHIDGDSADGLYEIADRFVARDLKSIGKILLSHKVLLKCGLCGKKITNAGHYRIDHDMPLGIGGTDTAANIQHSHNICTTIKGDQPGYISFYDRRDIVAEYMASEKYLIFLNQIDDLKKAFEKTQQPRMRPGRECNHALYVKGRGGRRR